MKILYTAGWAVAACLFLAACDGGGKEQTDNEKLPPPLVTVMELKRMDVPLYTTFMGQTLGSRSAAVKPQISGILLKRLFEEGAHVEKGDALFEIDSAPFKAALEQAQGQLASARSTFENARREYNRVQKLYAANAVSQQNRDNAQAAYQGAQAEMVSAQAAVDEAKIRLGYCRVDAPLSGYTSREVSTVGSLVGPDSTLTFINQSDPMDVQFAVPSVELFSMRNMEADGRAVSYGQGSTAVLSLLEGAEYREKGRVVFLDTQVDAATSSVRARARFPNPRGELLPGQFAAVRVGGAKLIRAIMVPQEALMQTEKGPCVYILEEGNRTSLVSVSVGPAFGGYFLVEKGLEAGQKIVVEGQDKATPGGEVSPAVIRQELKKDTLDTPDSSSPVRGSGIEAAPAPVKEGGHD